MQENKCAKCALEKDVLEHQKIVAQTERIAFAYADSENLRAAESAVLCARNALKEYNQKLEQLKKFSGECLCG